jgi:trimethylamine--corrinoid protein Co-methyltransferase
MVKFCVPGIAVTDATLSVDVIGEVGPFKDFLSHEDTYKGMRGQSDSRLIDRRVREEWTAAGATTMYDRSLAEAGGPREAPRSRCRRELREPR